MSKLEEFELKMEKTLSVLSNEYASIRAGRANPSVLDKVMVDYYGVPTQINQMAAISVSEARILVIQPWDVSTIKSIEKAISTSDIGIMPNNDGKVIRLVFPQLTEERRKDLVKGLHKYAEGAKISIRSIRREAMDQFKAMKKKAEITEDDQKTLEKEIQELTDRFCKQVDDLTKVKEKEIMEI